MPFKYSDFIIAEARQCANVQAIAEAILDNPSFSVYNNNDFLRHAASVPSVGPLTPADPDVEISRRVIPRFTTDDPA